MIGVLQTIEEFRDRQKNPRSRRVAEKVLDEVNRYLRECELALVKCGEAGVWGEALSDDL